MQHRTDMLVIAWAVGIMLTLISLTTGGGVLAVAVLLGLLIIGCAVEV